MCAVRRSLTNALIASTRPSKGKDQWLSDDDGSRGWGRLIIRIRETGAPLFYFKHSVQGKVYRRPLGRYSKQPCEGYLTLTEAKAIVRRESSRLRPPGTRMSRQIDDDQRSESPALALPMLSVSTVSEPSATDAVNGGSERISVFDLCTEYIDDLMIRKKVGSANTVRTEIKNHLKPAALASYKACEVTTHDAVNYLRALGKKCSPDKVNRLRSILLASYNLALETATSTEVRVDLGRYGIKSNPISPVQKIRGTSNVRNRALSQQELGHFWLELTTDDEAGKLKIRAIRIALLLGGQRCKQVLRAAAHNVNLGDKTILLFDPKGKRPSPRPHILPLCPMAYAEIEPLVKTCRAEGRDLIFPARRRSTPLAEGPVSAAVSKISQRLVANGYFETKFQYADIRQTCETRMSDHDIAISKDIRAQIQSHDLGGIQMTAYNRNTFLDEKWPALRRWEDYLMRCVDKAKTMRAQSAP